jgi:hypothetical protein
VAPGRRLVRTASPERALDFGRLVGEINSVRRMLNQQVDGMLLMASEYETKSIEPLFERKIPIVTVDRRKVEKGTCDVSIEFEDGYRETVMHLRNLGHRHIGFMGGNNEIGTSACASRPSRARLVSPGSPKRRISSGWAIVDLPVEKPLSIHCSSKESAPPLSLPRTT